MNITYLSMKDDGLEMLARPEVKNHLKEEEKKNTETDKKCKQKEKKNTRTRNGEREREKKRRCQQNAY